MMKDVMSILPPWLRGDQLGALAIEKHAKRCASIGAPDPHGSARVTRIMRPQAELAAASHPAPDACALAHNDVGQPRFVEEGGGRQD